MFQQKYFFNNHLDYPWLSHISWLIFFFSAQTFQCLLGLFSASDLPPSRQFVFYWSQRHVALAWVWRVSSAPTFRSPISGPVPASKAHSHQNDSSISSRFSSIATNCAGTFVQFYLLGPHPGQVINLSAGWYLHPFTPFHLTPSS